MDLLDRHAGSADDAVEDRPELVGVLGQLADDAQRGVEPVVHRAGELGLLGRVTGVAGEVLGQRVVGLAQRDAEPGRLTGEVAADLVGVQVTLGEQVADAGQRELPAVAGGAQELLEHRELDDVVPLAGLQPAVERGDVVGPGARQHLVDGDVGIEARGDLAEHLQQRVLAEGHRRVRLLPGEQRRVGGQVELVAGQPLEVQVSGRRRVEGSEQVAHRGPVVHRVVDVAGPEVVVLPLADVGVFEVLLRPGVVGQRQLVEVLAAFVVLVGDGGQLEDQGRIVGRVGLERAEPAYVGHLERAALAAEPTCVCHELVQGTIHGAPPSSEAGLVSRNQ